VIPSNFRQVWCLDTEFYQPDGERPRPICVVAREHYTGAIASHWLWGQPDPVPPFAVGPDVLAVCYSATAEWSVYLALGWSLPVRVLDLYAEYRWFWSGLKQPGYGQLDAMATFGLPGMDERAKEDMRALCRRGGPFSPAEAREILSYCRQDVDGLAALFGKMAPYLDWPRALARGRYTVALATVEAAGVPIDGALYHDLREHRQAVRRELIREQGEPFGVFNGERFDSEAFGDYLAREGIPWPRTPTGRLSIAEQTFDEAVDVYPQLRPLCELRSALSQLKEDGGLSVGSDSRNRVNLRPFATSSGRNAPSTTRFVFGKSTAFRSLIKPEQGQAVAYIDWAQQEFAIAAVLSDDHNMRQAYLSGDPYLEFARQAGLVPSSATKKSHCEVRDLCKTCILGVNYGMQAESLARRLRRPVAHARELLQLHRQVYRRYWRWAEQVQDQAMLPGRLHSVFGWQVIVGPEANARSLGNFLMQSNGAELLKLACCLATERGVRVVAPVHDALLVEGSAHSGIDTAVREVRRAMDEASRVVLDGLTLRTDVKIVRSPQRYRDPRGARFWALLTDVLARVKGQKSGGRSPLYPPVFSFFFLLILSYVFSGPTYQP
jgi:hypothetical protein